MSAINVNSITGRTGTHGPVLTGVTTATNGLNITGGALVIGGTDSSAKLNIFGGDIQIGTGLTFKSSSSTGNLNLQGGFTYPGGWIKLSGGSSDDNIVFGTSGNNQIKEERLRITSAGNVGIGTNVLASSSRLTLFEESGNGQTIEIKAKNSGGAGSQPGIKFTADNGDNIGGVYGDVNSDALKIQTGGTDRLTITNAGIAEFVAPGRIATFTGNGIEINNSLGSNIFIGTQSGAEGKMGTINNAAMALFTNNDYAKRVELQTTGDFAIMDGNLIVANGHGINFSATTPDGTVPTSELLDDYEEGTWTPTLTSGTASLSDCIYTKIGNIVTLSGYLYNFSDRSSSNNIGIQSLPYNNAVSQACGNTFGRYLGVDGAGGLCNYVSSNTIYIYEVNNSDYLALEHADLTNVASAIYFAATYRTTS